ncbi:MAG: metallophosphoesterase [Candidatus Hydrogenedentes bacterium]|nr:metallophosphoesterase [Candidatus Hydrogenedentota bacterium]
MKTTVAVISDVHFDPSNAASGSARRGAIADILFLRAVHRLNRMIRPDLTLLLGDLVNRGESPEAPADLARIRAIAGLIESPVIAIPGNHDGDPDAFYSAFERPAPFCDVHGIRFVPFVDPEEPGYNARRTPRDIERMAQARAGFAGPIVAVHHAPLFPPGAADCPYNYTNADDVIDAMRAHGISLAIGAHYHAGMAPVYDEGVAFIAAPALCESPFRFLEIVLDGDDMQVHTHALRMPDELALVDTHVHTHLAYCSENMSIPAAMALAQDFGLAGCVFTEHSGHLYFDKETYWAGRFLPDGVDYAGPGRRCRMDEYLDALAAAGCPPENAALEVDCDFRGRPVIRPADRGRFRYLTGAIHQLDALNAPRPGIDAVAAEFMASLDTFIRSGIRVLAHPFRVFRRAGLEPPATLFGPVARLLRDSAVAAEINFHTNEPPPRFVRLCIDLGVGLTLGSDAHNLYEVGEFAPHLALLKACGYDGPLGDILVDPRHAG